MDTQRSPVSKRQLQAYASQNYGRTFRAFWKCYKKASSVSSQEKVDILKIYTKHMNIEEVNEKISDKLEVIVPNGWESRFDDTNWMMNSGVQICDIFHLCFSFDDVSSSI